MSIPDIDYELGLDLGQFEYSVPMARAVPEDMSAVAIAFRAGEQKVVSILKEIANRDGRIFTSITQIQELLSIKKDD